MFRTVIHVSVPETIFQSVTLKSAPFQYWRHADSALESLWNLKEVTGGTIEQSDDGANWYVCETDPASD